MLRVTIAWVLAFVVFCSVAGALTTMLIMSVDWTGDLHTQIATRTPVALYGMGLGYVGSVGTWPAAFCAGFLMGLLLRNGRRSIMAQAAVLGAASTLSPWLLPLYTEVAAEEFSWSFYLPILLPILAFTVINMAVAVLGAHTALLLRQRRQERARFAEEKDRSMAGRGS